MLGLSLCALLNESFFFDSLHFWVHRLEGFIPVPQLARCCISKLNYLYWNLWEITGTFTLAVSFQSFSWPLWLGMKHGNMQDITRTVLNVHVWITKAANYCRWLLGSISNANDRYCIFFFLNIKNQQKIMFREGKLRTKCHINLSIYSKLIESYAQINNNNPSVKQNLITNHYKRVMCKGIFFNWKVWNFRYHAKQAGLL